ncbi:hypothetical protein NDU88_002242 [Pleurodeles waltl]|uniref:Uncharacterized protein n=1 Tax=Pleurodeles waltl TaxID=8319 RepID=A0AAV7U988_PLEWA|nr:hypothetical protein NDU88_002242 [Pleurodeles waltl]
MRVPYAGIRSMIRAVVTLIDLSSFMLENHQLLKQDLSDVGAKYETYTSVGINLSTHSASAHVIVAMFEESMSLTVQPVRTTRDGKPHRRPHSDTFGGLWLLDSTTARVAVPI